MSLARASLPLPCQVSCTSHWISRRTRIPSCIAVATYCATPQAEKSAVQSNQVQLSNHSSAHWSSRQWIHMSRCPYLCQLREKMPRGAKAREQRAGPTPVVGAAAWPLIAARRVHDRAILLVKSRSSKDPALSYGASSTEGLSLAHS
jgi:hypothetical protein